MQMTQKRMIIFFSHDSADVWGMVQGETPRVPEIRPPKIPMREVISSAPSRN